MENKMTLPTSLNNDIWEYCRANAITNIDEFIIKLVKQGFTIEKFGATPQPNEKIVEKIVERTIEVPVPMIDTEISEKLKEHIELVETLRKELSDALLNNAELNKELSKKNNRDIYGE